MTQRLAIFGNSHLVPMLRAYRATPEDWPGFDIDFFGFRGDGAKGLQPQGDRLIATSPDTRDQLARQDWPAEIDLHPYDACVVVGLQFHFLSTLALWRMARWPALPSLQNTDDIARMRQTLISWPAAQAAVASALSATDAAQLAEKLHQATGRRIWLIPQQRLHPNVRQDKTPRFFGHNWAIGSGDAPTLSTLFDKIGARVATAHGAHLLAQPRETRHGPILTKAKYMEGQAEITRPDGTKTLKPDLTHATADYGAILLNQLAGALAPKTARRLT